MLNDKVLDTIIYGACFMLLGWLAFHVITDIIL